MKNIKKIHSIISSKFSKKRKYSIKFLKKYATYKNSYYFMYEFLDKSLKEALSIKTKYVYIATNGGDFLSEKQRVKNINEYKKRKKNRYRKRKIKRLIKPILFSLSILVIILINLCGNAIVSNYKYEINTLEQQLRKEEIALDQLKVETLQNKSITNIEENAKEKLNMDYPSESQIRYIDFNN